VGGVQLRTGRAFSGSNFTKRSQDIGRSSQHALLFQILDILLHFLTRAAQSLAMFETTPNFALFDPCEN